MATRIRLKRMGRRNRPSFRVVIMDSRTKRDGATIEELGWYDPRQSENNFSLKEDRIIHWLRQGAQPTVTVRNLMRKSGLLYRWHLIQQGLDEKTIDHELQKWVFDKEAREREKAEKKIKKAVEKTKEKVKVDIESVDTEAPEEKEVETKSEESVLEVETEETTEVELVDSIEKRASSRKKEEKREEVSEEPEPVALSESEQVEKEKTEDSLESGKEHPIESEEKTKTKVAKKREKEKKTEDSDEEERNQSGEIVEGGNSENKEKSD